MANKQTIVRKRTHKEPFGRLKKERNGTKIGAQSGLKRVQRTLRVTIGLSTTAHCTRKVHGLRTIGMVIGGTKTQRIGLRTGLGLMIRLGIGRQTCHSLRRHSRLCKPQLLHLPRLRLRPLSHRHHLRLQQQSLSRSDQIANESLIASTSSNSRGSGISRTSRPGIAGKLFVGALMLVGTLSSSVPVIPEHPPLSAPMPASRCVGMGRRPSPWHAVASCGQAPNASLF